MRTCLRRKGKSLGRKCVKDLAEGGHQVTDRVAEKAADADQVADAKKIIRLR